LPVPVGPKILSFLSLFVLLSYVLWCFWPKLRIGLKCETLKPNPPFTVSLTFDDGPTAELSQQILDLLAKYRRRASFFVLVDKAIAHPDLIRRIVSEGHILGLHGQDHRLPFFRGTSDLRESLKKAKEALEEIAGQSVNLYRPSHGWKNLSLVRAAHSLGLRFCFWDWGVWDTDSPGEDELKRRLEVVCKKSGALLLHDGRGDAKETPAHARTLLEGLKYCLEVEPTRMGA
jgi:peptidoglycan/xylan/chitin deacetylase (PgdA/CDA1 family)